MKYHIEKPIFQSEVFGVTYRNNHPVYDYGTLFLFGKKGLVIIQQFIDSDKRTYWGPVEPYLINAIFITKDFEKLFERYSSEKLDGSYPTITIRHALHWLKMKPPKKELWETYFDRSII